MRQRTTTVISMGIMTLVGSTLAGCTSSGSGGSDAAATASPAPAAADCTPGTSTIYWDEARSFGAVPVGSYLLEYSEPGAATTTIPINLEREPEYPGDGLNMLTQFDADAVDEWHIALLTDLQRTGQVPRDFGEPTTLPSTPSATMSTETPGTRALVVTMDQIAVPYEIDCRDVLTEGSVVAVDTNNATNIFFDCSALPMPATPESEVAEETCAGA
ncbi:MAG: hypothetical protein ABWY54_03980 [Glaciihabitans sp.]